MTKTASRVADRVLWMDEHPKPKGKAHSRRLNFFVFAIPLLLLIFSALFFVWSRIQVIQLGYEISSALKEGRSLVEGNKQLRIEIATLKSYARIEQIAVEQLHMSKPKPDQVVVIR